MTVIVSPGHLHLHNLYETLRLRKENNEIIRILNSTQVNVLHVNLYSYEKGIETFLGNSESAQVEFVITASFSVLARNGCICN